MYKQLFNKRDPKISGTRFRLFSHLQGIFQKLFMAYRLAGYESRDIRDVVLDALDAVYSVNKQLEKYDEVSNELLR